MGLAAGASVGAPGAAETSEERPEACFSAAGCEGGGWDFGLWEAIAGRIFSISIRKCLQKIGGWCARFLSIFGRFWVFSKLAGLYTFVHLIS